MQALPVGHGLKGTASVSRAESLCRPRPLGATKDASKRPAGRVQALPRGPADALADRIEDPILRTAVKEPVAFWGGIFAGALGLNLDEEPLKSFLERSSGKAQTTSSKPQDQQKQQGQEESKSE